MTKTATHYTEDDIIWVTFESEGQMTDYGVPRSPVWWEPTEIEVQSLYILGEQQDFDTLSAEVQSAILSLADNICGSEWE
jgi:hypothetical protein